MEVLAGLSAAAISAALIGLLAIDGLVLVGVLIPGDLVVVAAASTVGLPGILGVGLLGAAALVGGHVASFAVGRRYGPHLWTSRLGRKVGLERWCRAEQTLREGGDRIVLVTPFLPVVNTVLPALAGALGVPPRRYLALIVVADLAWVGTWAITGVTSGLLATALGAADLALLVSGLVAATAMVVTALLLRRSHRRAAPLRCEVPGAVPGASTVSSPDAGGPAISPADQLTARRVTAQHRLDALGAGTSSPAGRRRADGTDLEITVRRPLPEVGVVSLEGRLTIATSPRFDQVLSEEVAAGADHLVIDLEAVRFLNYHALVALVAARHHAEHEGVDLHLVGVDNRVVRRALHATGTAGHFACHGSLPALLDDLSADRARRVSRALSFPPLRESTSDETSETA